MDQQINLANVFFTFTEIYMLIQIFRDLRYICSITDKNRTDLLNIDPLSTVINPLSTPLLPPSTNLDPPLTPLGPVNIGSTKNTPLTTLTLPDSDCFVYPQPITVPAYVQCDPSSHSFYNNCYQYKSLVDENGVMFGWEISLDYQGRKGKGYVFGEADKPNRTASGLVSFDYSDGKDAGCIDEPITWRSRKIPDSDTVF